MNIAELEKGDTFRVVSVTASGEIGKRLADMGFTRGVEGSVVRSALLGDPVQIRLMGYNVSIRLSEASSVEVEVVSCGKNRHRHGKKGGFWCRWNKE